MNPDFEIRYYGRVDYIAVNGEGSLLDEKGNYKPQIEQLYEIYRKRIDNKTPALEAFWHPTNWKNNDVNPDDRNTNYSWKAVLKLPEENSYGLCDDAISYYHEQSAESTEATNYSFEFFSVLEENMCSCRINLKTTKVSESIRMMEAYLDNNSYSMEFTGMRMHHEIYIDGIGNDGSGEIILRIPVRRKSLYGNDLRFVL